MPIKSLWNKLRGTVLRGVQLLFALDGLLHVAEFASAVNEGAKITSILTGLHAGLFFLGVYFIGHDHKHHEEVEK